MVLEMVFQVVCYEHPKEPTSDTITIVEVITSRVLDGANLCLFSLTLLYLYAYQDGSADEETFFSTQRVNMANKPLISLFRYFHLVLLKLQEQELAHNFIKSITLNSSEVYIESLQYASSNEEDLVQHARLKGNTSTLKEYPEFLNSISDVKLKTKQYSSLLATLKKAYYIIAMRVGVAHTGG